MKNFFYRDCTVSLSHCQTVKLQEGLTVHCLTHIVLDFHRTGIRFSVHTQKNNSFPIVAYQVSCVYNNPENRLDCSTSRLLPFQVLKSRGCPDSLC